MRLRSSSSALARAFSCCCSAFASAAAATSRALASAAAANTRAFASATAAASSALASAAARLACWSAASTHSRKIVATLLESSCSESTESSNTMHALRRAMPAASGLGDSFRRSPPSALLQRFRMTHAKPEVSWCLLAVTWFFVSGLALAGSTGNGDDAATGPCRVEIL